jgi:hypothetical protein
MVSAFLALFLSPSLAIAQGWPTERPIRLIVPFQADGSSTIARIVVRSCRTSGPADRHRQPRRREQHDRHRSGRAPADGYTLGLANTTTCVGHRAVANPSYDPVRTSRRSR